ncbi:MAG: pyridoxal phosphate-dependent aminotransferase [Myxococcales bacterium]|nr:pyridoxal phosphate-dependent aminotransferase [Myxococcales bacterium]
MFSQRIPWQVAPNRLSTALDAYRQAGSPLCDLTIANPTRALSHLYDDSVLRALCPLSSSAVLHYEPTPRGLLPCREAIAAYYARRGISVNPDQLVLCASTSEAYGWLFQLLCDPGDGVLFPQPSYPLIDHLARLNGVDVIPYPLRFCGDHFVLDRVALEQRAQGLDAAPDASPANQKPARPRALICISPNNPTGSILRRSELHALWQLCRNRNLALIVDEVFSDYGLMDPAAPSEDPRDPRLPSVLAETPFSSSPKSDDSSSLTFVLSGLSKVLGLPQLKLGWIHIRGPEPLRSEAQDRLELIADTFLSVNTPVQQAASELLSLQPRLGATLRSHLQSNLDRLRVVLRGSAVSALPVEGGWYAVLRLPAVLSDEDWALRLLHQDGVLVHPGYFFDLHEPGMAFVVISLLTAGTDFQAGLQALRDRVTQALHSG